ncbi:hypothetical protein BGZ63DRAFT_405128 [Mariannaea sp. PMI_226]|nr:hypothetical protein BGZ63DRAFT_405128 [Mariannaea sp. PMI_226]
MAVGSFCLARWRCASLIRFLQEYENFTAPRHGLHLTATSPPCIIIEKSEYRRSVCMCRYCGGQEMHWNFFLAASTSIVIGLGEKQSCNIYRSPDVDKEPVASRRDRRKKHEEEAEENKGERHLVYLRPRNNQSRTRELDDELALDYVDGPKSAQKATLKSILTPTEKRGRPPKSVKFGCGKDANGEIYAR